MDTAMYDPTDRVALGTFKVCADEYGCRGGAATLATRRPNLGRFVFGWYVGHRNPMRRQRQFTVKRPEKRVDLTVAPEQQPCCVQVVEWVGLAFTDSPILHPSCRRVCGGGHSTSLTR